MVWEISEKCATWFGKYSFRHWGGSMRKDALVWEGTSTLSYISKIYEGQERVRIWKC
jgi:hypothetical protein